MAPRYCKYKQDVASCLGWCHICKINPNVGDKIMEKAELGTIINGTLRTKDLIPAFTQTLKELDKDGK